MNQQVYISVLMPVRNEADILDRYVRMIEAQDVTWCVEYILLDGSDDDVLYKDWLHYCIAKNVLADSISVEVGQAGGTFRYIQNVAKTVSHGLNIGILESKGEIIIRWDAHTDYASDYISQCVSAIKYSNGWNVGGPALTRSSGYVQRAIAAAYHSVFSVGGARFHDPEHEGYVDTVPYGCWWKTKLLELGCFDEDFVRNQDDELNLRIIRAGGMIYQTPKIRSWYHPRSSLRDLFRQYSQYGYWKVRVIRKHKIPSSPRHLVPVLFLTGVVLGAIVSLLYAKVFLVYTSVLFVYFSLSTVYSFGAAAKSGWDILPIMPLTFLTYHISYGLGFMAGLIDGVVTRGNSSIRRHFVSLSR